MLPLPVPPSSCPSLSASPKMPAPRARPMRIVTKRRPAPLHLQKLIEARKPRVPPSDLPRAGAAGIGFYPPPTAVSVEHGSRFAHIPHSPIHAAPRSPRLSSQRLEERESSETAKLAVSFDAPAWTQIDNVKILAPSHPIKHRAAPASCRPGGLSIIGALPLWYESRDMLPDDPVYTKSPISPRLPKEQVLSELELDGGLTTTDPATDASRFRLRSPRSPTGSAPRHSPAGVPARRSVGLPATPRTPNESRGVTLLLHGLDKQPNSFTPSPPVSPNKYNRHTFFPNSPRNSSRHNQSPRNSFSRTHSPDGTARVQHLEMSLDEKALMKKGYTKEQLRPSNKHILGPLLRDKQHSMVYRALHGPDGAEQHERYSHRVDRRHVTDSGHGKRHVIPPYETKRHGAHILIGHIGEANTGNSLRESGMCTDTGMISSRGHRKQFQGSAGGGLSSIRKWGGRLG